jgi:CubicO group peptidase (beta-lactamase class C family)
LVANIAPDKTPMSAALQMAQQPLADGPDPAVGQGLGWMIYNSGRPDALYFKTGATAGFSSYIAFSSEQQNGFAVVCNGPGVSTLVPALGAVIGQPSAPTEDYENGK